MVISYDPDGQVFVATIDGTTAGTLHYRAVDSDAWQMYSTVVAPRFEGRGVGSALVRAALAAAVAKDLRIDPTCWFVAGWLDRHPDVLARRNEADVVANRDYWDSRADQSVAAGRRQWAAEPNWGLFGVPEADLRLLPPAAVGLQSLELGCGTGYVSGWLARRGAEAVGLDNSARQLGTARTLAAEHGIGVSWIQGNAERLPFADESFDLAVTEYGAVTWADPQRWVPEAARVLRPGGRLSVFGGTAWLLACTPLNGAVADRTLHRPYFGASRTDWRDVEIDPGGIDYTLTVSGWFELFSAGGFRVERFQEIQAPADAQDHEYVTGSWAQEFPAEQAWVLTRL
jgi:SAM-dependent methyltransferase